MKHRSKLVSSGFIFDIIYSTSIDVDDDDDDDDDVNVRRFYVEKAAISASAAAITHNRDT